MGKKQNLCMKFENGEFKTYTFFNSHEEEGGYYTDTVKHTDSKGTMTLVQSVVGRGMFQPPEYIYMVVYESNEQEDDAKRMLMDALVKHKEFEIGEYRKSANCISDKKSELIKLSNLRSKLDKTETWCRIDLYNEQFTVSEFERPTENAVADYNEGITDYGDFVEGKMTAYCKKENLLLWEENLIFEMRRSIYKKEKKSREQYQADIEKLSGRRYRLQLLYNELTAEKKEKRG